MKNPTNSRNKPNVVSIRMESSGALLTIKCSNCEHLFESYVTTIGGIAFVQAKCERCGIVFEIGPDDYQDILDRLFGQKAPTNQGQMLTEATRITENWHQCEPFKELLELYGVDLGFGAERDLMPIVLQGLIEADKESENGNGG